MTTVNDIYAFLNTYCPFSLAEEWDRAGLQVGRFSAPVTGVLLDLDATAAAIEEAAAGGFELLLTHHPLSMEPLGACTDETGAGRRALLLAERGIAHIACHTNLDACEGGVNTQLAALCGMPQTTLFAGFARQGAVNTTVHALAARLKEALPAAGCRAVICRPEVRRLAVVGGSGGSLLEEARAAGCDTLVTGEAKHHHFLLARELGLNLLVLGHYETEYPALPPLAEALRGAFPALRVAVRQKSAPAEAL